MQDKYPGSYFRELIKKKFVLKRLVFFVANPNPGSGAFFHPVSEMEKFGSRIRDPG
jgi:hypothetical protein